MQHTNLVNNLVLAIQICNCLIATTLAGDDSKGSWVQDVNRRLREEQDAEYKRSLEADRERERRQQAASAAEAEAKRKAEEVASRERYKAFLP